MKKIVFLFAFLMATVAIAGAQDKTEKTPEDRANREADRMKMKLNLNNSQRTQAYGILLDRNKQMKSLMEDSNSKMKNMLNDDQKKKFDQMVKEKCDKWKKNDKDMD